MSNLLFIGPKFYNYHLMIKEAFEKKGYTVDYYDDRPSTSFLSKAIIRINKKLLNHKTNNYLSKIIKETSSKKYDIVFVIYGQSFSRKMIHKLRLSHPEAKYIFYMYDPIASMPDRIDFAKEFDHAYTFDYEDSEKYGLELIPLFFKPMDMPKEKIEYDAAFIGTMMPGKFTLVNEIIQQLKDKNYKVFDYQYIQSKSVMLYYKLSNSDFSKAKSKQFKYKRLTMGECSKYTMQSKIIIDCPKENQTGLTIRTFEILFANKKLITTNKSIVNYDFYRPENIYIFDGEFNFDDIFFNSDYKPIDEAVLNEYSIDSWCEKILK